MFKLNLNARIEIALVAVLLLGSCKDSAGNIHTVAEAYDLADVARANSANALDQAQMLESRVSDIESRLRM